MSSQTPLNRLTFPDEHSEPFFSDIKGFFLGVDSSIYANADNGNLTYSGGGLFTWNAGSSLLTWTADIKINGFTTTFSAFVSGPPTGGQLTINNGEVAFYTMARRPQADTPVYLTLNTRIFQPDGTRLNDLRRFVVRIGDTLFFPDGKSLKNGESAILFGAGTGNLVPPHQHQTALIFEPPTVGISTLNLQISTFTYTRLVFCTTVGAFSVGETVTGSLSGTTGVVVEVGATYILLSTIVGTGFVTGETATGSTLNYSLNVNTVVGTFNLDDACSATGATGIIRKITGSPTPTNFIIRQLTGAFPGSGTLTDTATAATANITSSVFLGNPNGNICNIMPPSNLLRLSLYRNGFLLAEGPTRDYTLNYATGIVTLILPTVTTTERFVALRETVPNNLSTGAHLHSRLPIPIIITGITLDMFVTSSSIPYALKQISLYRNGLLQAEPGDYSLDLPTGIVTLVSPALPGELFIADRELA